MARPSLPTLVAIDGPAGSGKSSVSRAVARRLGLGYLDTGAAYRALAWLVLERNIDLTDLTETAHADAIDTLLKDFDYTIGIDPDEYFVTVGETDVTDAIRSPEVSAVVSSVARVPAVRTALTELFRSIAANADRPGVVVEGRDITTRVAPEAEVRILLTASEEARMGRRSAEITTQSAETVAEQLRSRDRADSQVVDFMSAADGVITVDSTHLDFEQTIEAVIDVIQTRTKRAFE
ncbi:(d)CMP kinase [Cryobacterium sp. PH29-G1]|uniref:(d)CMP kinase n=1 Tax=Cryobacterium sp. PH29-G1 TaxID=3046211 RepID=UPI0024BB78C8|nr:(d)CMP kinase [Cryobacterium sp. PH29-G1]MDJ0349568.1 (d)CMP kinase [Cryobacterium sp. PH29-G1]